MGAEGPVDTLTIEQFKEALEAHATLDRPYITRALEFAIGAHTAQSRQNGEPYIIHPIAVAHHLLQMGMDKHTIAAGLLHDVLEDTSTTFEQLAQAFGATTSDLVQGVTKIGKLHFTTRAEAQVENLRKMLLAMCRDIRVIIIKLADRLHNLMTLKYLPPQKQQRIAQETLEIYAPLAHRLGIAKIQWDMEDLCLRYLEPDVYFDLVRKVNEKRQERDGFIQKLKGEVEEVTRKGGIEARVTGRPKSFYSIYKKTLKRDKTLSEIYDLVGVRVITQTIPNCYEVLGLLHETWKPLPNRFKDYIAVPKANMYQSLHTTLIHPDGKVFEVQIRTEDMDRIAETGVAAHWAYKDGGDPKKEVQEKLTWLRQILDWSKEVTDSSEFVDGLKLDLFQNQVYVFTPNGRVVELPAGATPLDFAYAIHTDVGHTCVGAHVNGKIVPLTFELKNGQIVHIITNKNSKGPSRDWLDVVKSSRARNKIKQFLKNENREEYLIKGREIVQEELKKALKGHPDPNLTPGAILKSEELRNEIKVAGFLDLNSFFASVGRNEFPIVGFVKGLSVFKDQAPEPALPPTRPPTTPLKSSLVGSKGILVAGMNDMLVRLSKCCNPVVGDGIVGYITRGRGVSVHRVDCPNIEMLKADKDRQVGVSWDLPSLQGKDTRFLVEIEARVYDRPNVLLKVTNVISNYKLNIHAAQARITRQGQGLLSFSLEISSTFQLNNLLDSVRELPEVQNVYRVQPRSKGK